MRPTQIWPVPSSYLTHFSSFLSLKHAGLASTPGLQYLLFFTRNALPKYAYTHSLTPCRSHSNATWTQRSSLTTPATLLPSTLVRSPSWFSWPHTLYTHFFYYLFLPHYKASSMRGRTQCIMVQWLNLYSHFTDENTESQWLHTRLILKIVWAPKPWDTKPNAFSKESTNPKSSFSSSRGDKSSERAGRTSLVVQWLRFHASNAGGLSS